MRYNEYLFAARREKMQVYVDTIKRLSDIEQQTIATIAELQDIQKNMEAEQAQLVLQQQQRQQMALEADAAL